MMEKSKFELSKIANAKGNRFICLEVGCDFSTSDEGKVREHTLLATSTPSPFGHMILDNQPSNMGG